LKEKVAVVPEKEVVATVTPLASNVTLVISPGFPVPVTDKVKLVILIVEVMLGFVRRTC
jgi:hypothetical protein